MQVIVASPADLNAYLEQQERLRDTSADGVRDAARAVEAREGPLTDKTVRGTSRALEQVAVGRRDDLTDLSVRGQQRAIDALEAADPYGLRTRLPAHVEELARLKDLSTGGIQGATALIRVVENRADLTDKSVGGMNRARDVIATAAPIAYLVDAPRANEAPAVAREKTWWSEVKGTLERAKSVVRSWLS